jgi:Trm5-related predicted tRNA methylase
MVVAELQYISNTLSEIKKVLDDSKLKLEDNNLSPEDRLKYENLIASKIIEREQTTELLQETMKKYE